MYLPTFGLELTIAQYLDSLNTVSGSLLSGSNVTYHRGFSNEDKAEAPAVIINAADGKETYFDSGNYEFFVSVKVKEIAADIDSNQIGVLAGYIFNEFANSYSASVHFSNPSNHINIWQVQKIGFLPPTVMEDAIVYEGQYRMVGALVP